MEKIELTETGSKNVLLRKCIDCGKIFESEGITCPDCGSKMTTCSFKDEEEN